MTRAQYLSKLAKQRVLILDGAMGTQIQKIPLSAEDVTYASHQGVYGCNELLNLSRSDIIFDIHLAYLQAGADIIETNTFGANAFSLAEYGLAEHVYDINLAAVEIARAALEVVEEEDASRYAFIAGVIGPTGKSLSFSPSVDDPSYRQYTFDDFVDMYKQQVRALLDGGVDLLLIETVFDTLVSKAAIVASLAVMDEQQKEIPIMVSVTFSDKSRRTLSGQTLEAFINTLSHYPLFSLGVNCSTGPEEMLPLVQQLAKISPFRTSAHPNAGFPDNEGTYTLTPDAMAQSLKPILDEGMLNIVGGCCGTTPEHIAEIVATAQQVSPRSYPTAPRSISLCGLEPLQLPKDARFIAVGERTNVAGSRKFARLIKERKFDQALAIARTQIEQGASVIDICMDDPLIDPIDSMVTFLRLAAAEPEIARVPFMIDSSDWDVIVGALKEVQGRAIVNSISLKEGETLFLERARYIQRMGCAMVVMLFDEAGQADTYERKCQVAERSYKLLVDTGTCDPSSIIFDPNVLAIATGIDGHDFYASDFIRAVHWIKQQFPSVLISGGISNLSFSFRGNNGLREAIHALFLDYAIDSGLTMAIVNPSAMIDSTTIDDDTATIIREALIPHEESAITAREALITLALTPLELKDSVLRGPAVESLQWRSLPVSERLSHALLIGDDAFMPLDLEEAKEIDPVTLIEGPLMDGMAHVGRLFGEGKLFLPQVVRSARVMKRAVDILQPRLVAIQAEAKRSSGTIVLATVKGDVHDIGKNIVSLVLQCNNFTVIDLGVMVSASEIFTAAQEHHADIVGLSGLITPSLVEMAHVCKLFAEADMQIPIMVGGATTSVEHTARKLAPVYPRRVFHSSDASDAVTVALKLISKGKEKYINEIHEHYVSICDKQEHVLVKVLPLQEASKYAFVKEQAAPPAKRYGVFTIEDVSLEDLLPLVRWSMVASGWRVPVHSHEAKKLRMDAEQLLNQTEVKGLFKTALKASVGIFPAKKVSDTTIEMVKGETTYSLDFLRMQIPAKDGYCRSLADYVHPFDHDSIGMFVATAGLGVDELVQSYRKQGDDYHALLLSMLSDRLAEAFSEYLEHRLASEWWQLGNTPVIRPAVGYPSAPDHHQKSSIFSLLEATERIGVELTDGYAMRPASSVCGFYFAGSGCGYFSLGPIGEDQMASYIQKGGRNRDAVERSMRVTVSPIIKEEVK